MKQCHNLKIDYNPKLEHDEKKGAINASLFAWKSDYLLIIVGMFLSKHKVIN